MVPHSIAGIVFLAQQHKFIQKYGEAFFWGGGAAAGICMKICIACSHVGQMLFAGNKYLLLKRITVHCRNMYKNMTDRSMPKRQ
jgi:hypothetical protein